MTEESPSNCTYCYTLECVVRIASLVTSGGKGAVTAKKAIATVGRNSTRQILLQVELLGNRNTGQPLVVSYALSDAIVHQQMIAQGRASVEIPSKRLVIQISNCPPRKLNVFVKSLLAKLEIMRSESNSLKTPSTRSNILNELPKILNVLSPLTVGEIRIVRSLRGVVDSPLTKCKASETSREGTNAETSTESPVRRPLTALPNVGLKRLHSLPELKRLDSTKINVGLARFSSSSSLHAQGKRYMLSKEQKFVVRCVVQHRQNVFFTGPAGTGKSLILQRIIEMLPADSTFITAATGVAACQLGGMTLHSFAGFGVGQGSAEECLGKVRAQKHIMRLWNNCSHLIIDEISMIESDFFTKLNYVACNVKNRHEKAFGGIQLIITGDFLQLPPVCKGTPSFCFESASWRKCVDRTIFLKQVRRQEDVQFVKILQKIRIGECNAADEAVLRATSSNTFDDVVPTRLCTHTLDAQRINKHKLEQLESEGKTFVAVDDGPVSETLQAAAAQVLELKVGAQVMLTKNLDLSRGLSNGSRGHVVRFSAAGHPVVFFQAANDEVEVSRVKFQVRIPGRENPATRLQIPLLLAWAISIHKSQGLTLDALEVSLTNVFAEGQAYVALSRARSLSSIKVLGFHASSVQANRKVVDFYNNLQVDADSENEENSCDFVIRKRARLSC